MMALSQGATGEDRHHLKWPRLLHRPDSYILFLRFLFCAFPEGRKVGITPELGLPSSITKGPHLEEEHLQPLRSDPF
jgi:hypothetical protein